MFHSLCVTHPSTTLEAHHPPPQLASRKLEPSSCAPWHHSATDSSLRGLGTAVLLLGATCYLAANPASLLWRFSLSLRARYRSVLHHHLATASEHSAAGVLLVLLLPDQGEVQVHVLCHLQHQDQAGILKATLSRGISNLNSKSGMWSGICSTFCTTSGIT